MCCITASCISLFITLTCFVSSIVCLYLFIYFSHDDNYDFLGELSVFLLVFSFISYTIQYNIRMSSLSNRQSSQTTKVTPITNEGVLL